jgi:hypothetical protein
MFNMGHSTIPARDVSSELLRSLPHALLPCWPRAIGHLGRVNPDQSNFDEREVKGSASNAAIVAELFSQAVTGELAEVADSPGGEGSPVNLDTMAQRSLRLRSHLCERLDRPSAGERCGALPVSGLMHLAAE